MYEEYFEMKHTPFSRDIPAADLYESAAMAEALARLEYVAEHQLFAVVTSDAGCGKSTLIRKFAASLKKDKYILLYISDSRLSPSWLYKEMLTQLGLIPSFYRTQAKHQLTKEIEIIRAVHGQNVICVLDEAHLLDKETIEEFRFLLNYQYDSKSPIALILVGQTELWEDKLRLKRYAAVRQRIDINCVLPPLDRSETEKYIRSHLGYAGCDQELFTARAIDEIHKISSGIPRIINRVCEKALMYAYQQRHHLIDDHIIDYVAEHEMLKGVAGDG